MLEFDINTVESVSLDPAANPFTATANHELIVAGAGSDTIQGMGGDDWLFGNADRDFLWGNEGEDVIFSGQGHDWVSGGDGDDWIIGDRDNDLVYGGDGRDSLSGGSENDEVYGNNGNDLLLGNQGRDRLFGGDGNDTAFGGKDDDRLYGDMGDDLLCGDLGDDTLAGGDGVDTLMGGSGRDRFIIGGTPSNSALANTDIIQDYTPGEDSLEILGELTSDRLELLDASGENNLLLRDRQTGVDLAVFKNVSRDRLERDLGLNEDSTNPVENRETVSNGVEENTQETSSNSGSSSEETNSEETTSEDNTSEDSQTPEVRVGFTQARYTISEDGGSISLTLERSDTSQTTSLDYATQDVTAKAGNDYTETSGTLTFNIGESRKTVEIPIRDDADDESNETFQVVLSNVTGGALNANDEASITIEDDDVPPTNTSPSTGALPAAISGQVVKFTPTTSEAEIAASAAQRLTLGSQTIYIGTWQKTGNNQNPIIASFDGSNPSNNWVRTDYEDTGADGRGYGLFWDGTSLYGVFATDGTQGSTNEDWRRASGDATQNWLKSYGAGGGAKIGVIGRIDPATGNLQDAAYLSAVLSNGSTNSLKIQNVSTNSNGNLEVQAQSWFNPRKPNGSKMTQVDTSLNSPFDYTIEITPDLSTVVSTSAVGWT